MLDAGERLADARYGLGQVVALAGPWPARGPAGIAPAFTYAVGAQNAFAADFHSRRRCAMSWARSSSLPPSSTWRSEGSARR
jgi:hypothetical protein